MNRRDFIGFVVIPIVLAIVFLGVAETFGQDVAHCKHGQSGDIIVIEANMACPFGYYRI